jgi:hypothetical protein
MIEEEEQDEPCSTCGFSPCYCDEMYDDYQEKSFEMFGDD